ncbi:GGDEF domain-containing protein [Breoghania sp. L-A4]|uniref:GGDEF domain-containing protein n=1 Tax=Breoghania sp. L-A4 TaxID=2304600 RepID=UPI000E35DCFF|nr:GGDEF domain-containing protein [Breoghania sp. L-A4]AXS41435.1 GGDEF domain-containing protein [Breoghania sp. L-A4]
MVVSNSMLLLTQAVFYFGVMSALLHGRKRFGLGLFLCALGVMHFLETYLASVFYIELPFGIISPGSTVLFSGKLLMILLLYIKEDATVVRQPIYGLLIGNFLIVGLVMILRNHEVINVVPDRLPDIDFLDEIGWLMVWGTALLFIDSIAIILLYERLGQWLRRFPTVRIFIAAAALLTFDQAGFFLALHYVSGAPWEVMFGGWAAKISAAIVFSLFAGAYLHWMERDDIPPVHHASLKDVFHKLTYRERYEDLLERTGRDGLTGVQDRGRFDLVGHQMLEDAKRDKHPVSLLMIDVDHFKSINDEFGHTAGDAVLVRIAEILDGAIRQQDQLFRYGGEEFVVLCDALSPQAASALADRLRNAVALRAGEAIGTEITVSIGVSSTLTDGSDLDTVFRAADARLYRAKRRGRNHVVSDDMQDATETA